MINFRYHIVSLAALFLALAAGIALGAGPLRGDVDSRTSGADTVVDRSAPSEDRAVTAFQADYAKVVGPGLVAGRLKGRSVAVVTLPGADAGTVKGIVAELRAAGALVSTQVALTAKFLDPAGRQFTQGVAQQALDGVSGVSTTGQSNYQLAGTALARAFLAKSGSPSTFDAGAGTVASALKEAGLISLPANPTARASLAVVVAGDVSARAEQGQDELVATVATSLDASSDGVLVAGPVGSARGEGFVRAVRDRDAAKTVSTVDVADLPAGQIVTVLALQRESSGSAGQYGAVDAKDGAMPALR